MKSDFNRLLFPLMYLTPRSLDARLFYAFCMRAYVVTATASILELVAVSARGLDENQLVITAINAIPVAVTTALSLLLVYSVYGFFRAIDFRDYTPFHWNPNSRFREHGAAARVSALLVPICLLILLFPQGLFLLLIEEYHALSETYLTLVLFVIVVVYVAPLMATFLLIAITTLITELLKFFHQK